MTKKIGPFSFFWWEFACLLFFSRVLTRSSCSTFAFRSSVFFFSLRPCRHATHSCRTPHCRGQRGYYSVDVRCTPMKMKIRRDVGAVVPASHDKMEAVSEKSKNTQTGEDSNGCSCSCFTYSVRHTEVLCALFLYLTSLYSCPFWEGGLLAKIANPFSCLSTGGGICRHVKTVQRKKEGRVQRTLPKKTNRINIPRFDMPEKNPSQRVACSLPLTNRQMQANKRLRSTFDTLMGGRVRGAACVSFFFCMLGVDAKV